MFDKIWFKPINQTVQTGVRQTQAACVRQSDPQLDHRAEQLALPEPGASRTRRVVSRKSRHSRPVRGRHNGRAGPQLRARGLPADVLRRYANVLVLHDQGIRAQHGRAAAGLCVCYVLVVFLYGLSRNQDIRMV